MGSVDSDSYRFSKTMIDGKISSNVVLVIYTSVLILSCARVFHILRKQGKSTRESGVGIGTHRILT